MHRFIVYRSILLIVFFASLARGQVVINGIVCDMENTPIPDVAVVVDSLSTIFYTDSTGRYTIEELSEELLQGVHTLYFFKFGWLGIKKEINIISGKFQLDTVRINFGDINKDGIIDLRDVALIHDVVGDSVSNRTRYMDNNANGIIDENDESKVISAVETQGFQCPEWLISKPDYVTFVPSLVKPEYGTNQHYLMTKLNSGRLLGIWTGGKKENIDQSILFHYSDDGGKTWSIPQVLDGPMFDGYNSSWGFPIYIPAKNRIYVFFNKDNGTKIYHSGDLWCRYSDDEGLTWSKAYKYKIPRGKYSPVDTNQAMSWWIYQSPMQFGEHIMVGFTEIWLKEGGISYASEVRFIVFDNIQTVTDPEKISIRVLPITEKGLRIPFGNDTLRSVCQEPSLVQLSDGRLFCVVRTVYGSPYYFISTDTGKSWSSGRPLRLGDGKDLVKQPVASCPIYEVSEGNFVLIFHNNSGDANGGKFNEDYLLNRTPSYILRGYEDVNKNQPISFYPPQLLLENYVRPFGPENRTEIATYPSITDHGDSFVLWYPDRKHFLLGKIIHK